MRIIFADAFYFFALVNERDRAHQRALEFLRTYQGTLITTDWVITEFGDGLSHPANRTSFLITHTSIQNEPNVRVIPFSDVLQKLGIELFRNRPDKHWSLTDCISFVVMQQEGITEALTGDKHFEQAGFVALLK